MKSVGGGMKRVGTTPSFISPSLNNNNNNNNNRIRMSIDWDDKESNGAAAASPPPADFFFFFAKTQFRFLNCVTIWTKKKNKLIVSLSSWLCFASFIFLFAVPILLCAIRLCFQGESTYLRVVTFALVIKFVFPFFFFSLKK